MPENATDRAAMEVASQTINIMRVSAGMRQKSLALLSSLEGELVKDIEAGAKTVNRNARLGALLRQTKASIASAYRKMADTTLPDLKGIAVLQGRSVANQMNAALGVGAEIFSVTIAPALMEAVAEAKHIFGRSAQEWWDAQDVSLRTRFASQMQMGILRGESVSELARRVRGTQAAAYKDGVMQTSRSEAESLVRNSAISTANAASLKAIESLEEVCSGVQWLATLDNRTTPICRALDGLKWTLPDYKPSGHDKVFPGTQAHWGCRSRPIPVPKTLDELMGRKLKALDGAELERRVKQKLAAQGMEQSQIDQAMVHARASMDGQVSRNVNFESWMNGKSDVEVDALLGPGRGKLVREGNVSLTDLTNQNNRPLTIKQLKASMEEGRPVPETIGLSVATGDTPVRFKVVEATAADISAESEIKKALADPATKATAGAVLTEHKDKSPSAQAALIEERAKERPKKERLQESESLEERKDGFARLRNLLPNVSADQIRKLANGLPGELVTVRARENDEGAYTGKVKLVIQLPHVRAERVVQIDIKGRLIIVNDDLYLGEKNTGRGFRTLYDQVKTAQELGVAELHTLAFRAEYANGYYTWARLGYDGPMRQEQKDAARKAFPELARDEVDPIMVSEMMATPERRAWWKKNGGSFDGTFDLTPDSRSMQMLEAYAKERAARAAKPAETVDPARITPDELLDAEQDALDAMQKALPGLRKDDIRRLASAPAGQAVRVVAAKDGSFYLGSQGEFGYTQRGIVRLGDGSMELENMKFFLAKTGTGMGSSIFYEQVKAAQALGIGSLSTTATKLRDVNGYYTWARLGYDGTLGSFMVRNIKEAFPDIETSEQGTIKVSQMMATPERRAWWKANGESFRGTFDLTPGSRSMQVLEAYMKERAVAR